MKQGLSQKYVVLAAPGNEPDATAAEEDTSSEAGGSESSDIESNEKESEEKYMSDDSRERLEVLLEELRVGLAQGERDMLTLEEVRKQLESEALQLKNRAEHAEALATNLETELSTAKDTSKRLSADFENFKRRVQSEKEQLSTTERSKVMESLLPVIDDFERARTSVVPETDGEEKIANGYQAIYSQLVSIFKDLGLKQVDTVGAQFDPEVHEAVMRAHSDEFAEDVVMEEFRKGFTVNDSLIRPAMVKVSQGPEEGGAEGMDAVRTDASGSESSSFSSDSSEE